VLALEVPRRDKRLLVMVETDGCFADGLSVVTGCWVGRRTLRVVDYGRVAATVVDTVTDRAVRLRPDPRARQAALDWAPDSKDRWHAQLLGYQIMPTSELLQVTRVTLASRLTQSVATPSVRVTCTMCGEDILYSREIRASDGPICRACVDYPYYTAISGPVLQGRVVDAGVGSSSRRTCARNADASGSATSAVGTAD
jgi:formylmethanofuran dehydrogenase subunit E